ncbi:hypothetical protein ARZXY2_4767 (plasmid) [Arthrobacter sp. ZXY-2]|nr:hypothetical protein ARZXY2_4767 [Arthrobacter sp. ZXY-2]
MLSYGICEVNGALRLGTPHLIEVCVENADDIDKALTDAVLEVRQAAIEQHSGILITRVAAGQYVVGAHSEVPFGLTRQQYR